HVFTGLAARPDSAFASWATPYGLQLQQIDSRRDARDRRRVALEHEAPRPIHRDGGRHDRAGVQREDMGAIAPGAPAALLHQGTPYAPTPCGRVHGQHPDNGPLRIKKRGLRPLRTNVGDRAKKGSTNLSDDKLTYRCE